MADNEKLKAMLDDLIDGKGEQAQVHFHDYLQTKMREVIGGDQKAEAEKPNTDKE